jgi:hypothetical protein
LLKNNKAFRDDQVINEYMKTTSNQCVDIYEKLVNLIFDTGSLVFFKVFKSLKKLKSSLNSISGCLVEFTSNQCVDIYEKLVNLIFDTGIIPESWLLGTIKPFYKNKGNHWFPLKYSSL